MRRSGLVVMLFTMSLLVVASAAVAQTPTLEGTVTLRGGQTLTGEIKVAQIGVLQGCGIGTLLPDLGFFKLKIGDEVQEVQAAELARVEIEWGLQSEDDPQSWEIREISILMRDGTQIVGTPTWSVQATSVVVGEQPSVYAFPKAGIDFTPNNLLASIEIAGAMPETLPPEGMVPIEPIEPATPLSPEEVPSPVVPPAETVPPETVAPPPVVSGEAIARPGANEWEFLVTCPECGKKILVKVSVQALPSAE